MSRFNFRHGMARRQQDASGNPTFLQVSGQFIHFIASPDPTVFLISHVDVDYAFSQNKTILQAWGPCPSGQTCWIYWDVNFMTGEITHGLTTVQPIDDPLEPTVKVVDLHWFDMVSKVMKVWTGSSWVEKLRVFAAEFTNGAVLVYYPLGSQIGQSNVSTYAGYPLFDDDGKPLQKFSRTRRGQFITTETPMVSQFAKLANFRVEAAINQGTAIEQIPVNYCVAYYGPNEIGLARFTDADHPAFGVAVEDMVISEQRSFITKGYVTDSANFNWTEETGTPLFVGATGELTSSPPQSWSIQQVGVVIDVNTIFVDIQPQMLYG